MSEEVPLPSRLKKAATVLTIGTFDGVHRGHRAILRRAAARALRGRKISAALAFERPPRLFFSPSSEPCLLTTPEEKRLLMEDCGIRKVVLLRFGPSFAKTPAKEFFEKTLVRRFRAAEILVGYDFRFGRGREGDTGALKAMGRARRVPVHIVGPVRSGSRPVSSGRIRDLLRAGELSAANRLLGHPYFAIGRVARGRGLGRKIGFPTANLALSAEKIVPPGVFAVRVREGSRGWSGVCNVGVRPTVRGGRPSRPVTEVHLFGFSGRLYGKSLRVDFIHRLRPERAFPNLEALRGQIRRDAARARKLLGRR